MVIKYVTKFTETKYELSANIIRNNKAPMKITRLNTHFHYNIKCAYVLIHNPLCRK